MLINKHLFLLNQHFIFSREACKMLSKRKWFYIKEVSKQ
ncbi:hypothetical protein B4153_2052 [Bacillus cereus]|uniref:Uncharacterized protein n=1 Tax=Bacillus cereus (strain 03BB102) TaxID=572264 RepID=A0A158RS56_BACC3|nr:conserved hypothetical protein [Bacillus cereus 03BB102]EDX62725.1 conserved hypothetical protein [Bacillus cereus 03BB108]KKZ96411.1 hypothetical protein B4153_2052 [Bacillus cereus]KLA19628.1 hypothetical protein B4078_1998 [Bacillus cereus]